MTGELTKGQGIQISREFASQLQRLSLKFQSFDLTYIELKEQIETVTNTLLAKISALEANKPELEKSKTE